MPRPAALDEHAIEFQVALRDLRRRQAAPLWESAVASGDWSQMSDAKALDRMLRAADALVKRMAGRASAPCADGLLEPGHGLAA
jgi:hypothetical protein